MHEHDLRMPNGSPSSSSSGSPDSTVAPRSPAHIELLRQLFLVYRLPPWSVNLGARQVKTPKLLLTDSGPRAGAAAPKARRQVQSRHRHLLGRAHTPDGRPHLGGSAPGALAVSAGVPAVERLLVGVSGTSRPERPRDGNHAAYDRFQAAAGDGLMLPKPVRADGALRVCTIKSQRCWGDGMAPGGSNPRRDDDQPCARASECASSCAAIAVMSSSWPTTTAMTRSYASSLVSVRRRPFMP